MIKGQINYNIDFNTGKITFIKDSIEYNINKNENNESIIKLAIVGSRSITDEKFVNRILNCYKFMFGLPIKVISGGAKGIDSIGESWADKLGIEKQIFLPDWDNNGKAAGFIRNEDIIKNCDVCLAIWDGESHGTKNDFELCEKYNKELLIFNMKEFNSGEFSGFHDIVYGKEKNNTPENPVQNPTQPNNRWLPQPGIIKL